MLCIDSFYNDFLHCYDDNNRYGWGRCLPSCSSSNDGVDDDDDKSDDVSSESQEENTDLWPLLDSEGDPDDADYLQCPQETKCCSSAAIGMEIMPVEKDVRLNLLSRTEVFEPETILAKDSTGNNKLHLESIRGLKKGMTLVLDAIKIRKEIIKVPDDEIDQDPDSEHFGKNEIEELFEEEQHDEVVIKRVPKNEEKALLLTEKLEDEYAAGTRVSWDPDDDGEDEEDDEEKEKTSKPGILERVKNALKEKLENMKTDKENSEAEKQIPPFVPYKNKKRLFTDKKLFKIKKQDGSLEPGEVFSGKKKRYFGPSSTNVNGAGKITQNTDTEESSGKLGQKIKSKSSKIASNDNSVDSIVKEMLGQAIARAGAGAGAGGKLDKSQTETDLLAQSIVAGASGIGTGAVTGKYQDQEQEQDRDVSSLGPGVAHLVRAVSTAVKVIADNRKQAAAATSAGAGAGAGVCNTCGATCCCPNMPCASVPMCSSGCRCCSTPQPQPQPQPQMNVNPVSSTTQANVQSTNIANIVNTVHVNDNNNNNINDNNNNNDNNDNNKKRYYEDYFRDSGSGSGMNNDKNMDMPINRGDIDSDTNTNTHTNANYYAPHYARLA